jgi:lipoprotein-anchoring transpeptidase ErfK/SrfK
MQIQKYIHNKIFIGIIISFCILLVIYFSLSIYFTNRFYFGSTVSCISVSGETVEEVDEQMPAKFEGYTLELTEKGKNKEQIKGTDIGLKYNSDGKIQKLKDSQNSFKWIIALFNKENSKTAEVVTYDDDLLKECINNLSCFDSNNIIEPQNPGFQYTDNGYEIVSEVYGNKVNKDALYDSIKKAIINGETIVDLESTKCYEEPQYNLNSKEVLDTKDKLNKYVSSKITYSFGDKTEVLDGSIINNWLKVNDNLEITFDENKIRDYVNKLSNNYNTAGKARDFTTSLGINIKIGGGDYGWIIDKEGEVQDLISTIKDGQTINKEPVYKQTAISHDNNDIGNTYVEVNMTKQHLWFYKNGALVVDGDVVTGNVSNNTSTPTGVYKLKYKERNATLKGEGYSTPVSFWMPFNGGVGMHDATWRAVFGGNIYRTNGSHGCVNEPYGLANTIFNNIDEGCPVICYY